MPERPRVVLDTNIFLAAFLSKNPSSPTKEILERWSQGEFDLLISPATLREVTEKLLEKKIARERVVDFLALLEQLAILIEAAPENPSPVIPDDPDDDHILACAVAGEADYLVTHDRQIGISRLSATVTEKSEFPKPCLSCGRCAAISHPPPRMLNPDWQLIVMDSSGNL